MTRGNQMETCAVLVTLNGVLRGTVHAVERRPFVLGRSGDCDLWEAFRSDGSVSRRHAAIDRQAADYVVRDLGSRNGTRVNGQRIHDAVVLRDGDEIGVGRTTFEFCCVDEGSGPVVGDGSSNAEIGSAVVDAQSAPEIVSSLQVAAREPLGDRSSAVVGRQFDALVKMLKALGTSLRTEDILRETIHGLLAVFSRAERGCVALMDPATQQLVPRIVMRRAGPPPQGAQFGGTEVEGAEESGGAVAGADVPDLVPSEEPSDAAGDEPMRISRTLADRVLYSCEAVLSVDVRLDTRFQASTSLLSSNIRSLLCMPILNRRGEPMGIVQLDSTVGAEQFDRQDLEVLASIAPHTGLALDYAAVHVQELERQRIMRELQLARRIQFSLMPTESPCVGGYQFSAHYEPARAVGGDYYGYLPLADGRLAILVADVVGKGIPASLLGARLAGEWKYLMAQCVRPEDVVAELNRKLAEQEVMGQFVTLVLAVLHPVEHRVTLVNAGHPAPRLRHADGRVGAVGDQCGGAAAGMFADEEFGSEQVVLEPGATLVLYTDGVTEAQNEAGEHLGFDRWDSEVRQVVGGPDVMAHQLGAAVRQFHGEALQSDDVCIVCLGRQSLGL